MDKLERSYTHPQLQLDRATRDARSRLLPRAAACRTVGTGAIPSAVPAVRARTGAVAAGTVAATGGVLGHALARRIGGAVGR